VEHTPQRAARAGTAAAVAAAEEEEEVEEEAVAGAVAVAVAAVAAAVAAARPREYQAASQDREELDGLRGIGLSDKCKRAPAQGNRHNLGHRPCL